MRLGSHDVDSPDPLKRPGYAVKDKARRLLWNIAHAILFKPTPVAMHNYRSAILRLFGAKIGSSNYIYPSVKIWAPWLLETEDVVTLGPQTEVYNPGGIKLGHHTIVSQGSYLCGAGHDFNTFSFDYVKQPITTDPYVWICAKAIVLPGVHCGTGSVLGTGSVTSRSLEPWTVYAGNPATAMAKRNQFDVSGLVAPLS